MAGEIPAAITIPDRIETRLGTLTFADGFPDDATVARLYDSLDFQRGVQAFLTAMPAASMRAQRRALLRFGPANQTVLLFESLMDSRSLFLTGNSETVAALVRLDLHDGPVVVELPPRLLGVVDDAWFHYVTDLGQAGPDMGRGGRFVFLPPGYRGETPQDCFAFQSHTFGNLIALRAFLVDGDTTPAVESLRKHLRIYPLVDAANPPGTRFFDVSGEAFNTIHSADLRFYEEIAEIVQEEPSEAIDPETLGLLAAIGIEKGRPFAPDARMRGILTEAAAVGHATARALAYRTRLRDAHPYPGSAWVTPFVGGSHEFLRDGARLLDARSSFFFSATGITPAMAARMIGAGSQHAAAFVDSGGRPLDGARTYRLHLPPAIPARNFWSLVVYDTQTRSMLQTDQRYPSIGSQRQGVAVNADTSVDVYFGPQAPDGKQSNWVQTWPGKGWSVMLRLYGPLEPWFDRSWRPGEIEDFA
jgi:hypothetical protein